MLHDKDLIQVNGTIFRVLSQRGDKALVINCKRTNMPYWIESSVLEKGLVLKESMLFEKLDICLPVQTELTAGVLKTIHERFSLIAGILPFIADESARSDAISRSAMQWKVSKQTIRYYLCRYLIYQDEAAFAPIRALTSNPM